MNYIVQACTDIGISKKTNQDSYSVKTFNTKIGKIVFAVLCDGMGGLDKGEVASATVVSAYNKWAESKLPELCEIGISDGTIREDWVGIAIECNERIKTYGKKCAVSLGTTVTAMLITDDRYYIVNVGDTRAYEICDSVSILTNDQTVVAREVSLGNITEEEAKSDSRRSVLLQCVGASDAVYPDMFFGNTKCNAVYMLCSDGFRHEISESEIYDGLNPTVMMSADEMKNNTLRLIDINKQRQEKDNISVITIRTF
ncbi:MAG: protein phosphatase 2C domain-containing protein [Eubacteriales bacterium]|nr:protein phosphatase 2C domain-containing protein [Eubacteriales bacterium]